jgi:hypothetical protein
MKSKNVGIRARLAVPLLLVVAGTLIPLIADAAVDVRWVRYWPTALPIERHNDSIAAMVLDPAGNVYVTGTGWNPGSTSFDFVTAKYDSNGGELWRSYYNGTQTGSVDGAIAIARGNDGGIYVTGTSQESGRRNYTTTVKYNGVTGAQIWATPFGLPKDTSSDEGASGLAYDDVYDIVYASGTSLNDPNDDDYVLIRYNPSNGAVVWTRYWDGGFAGNDYCVGMCLQIGNQNPVMTGSYYDDNSTSQDWGTVFYNSAGTMLWAEKHTWYADDDEQPFGLCSDSAGLIYVTGVRAAGSGIYFRLALLRLNLASQTAVATSSMGSGNNGDDDYWGVACQVRGSQVYVIGSFYDAVVSDNSGEDWGIAAWVTSFASNAAPVWKRYYDGGYYAFRFTPNASRARPGASLLAHQASRSGVRHRAKGASSHSGVARRMGGRDQEPGYYDSESPTAMTFDSQGRLYVAGYCIHGDGFDYWHVRRYTSSGSCTDTLDFRRDTLGNRPFAIACRDTNHLYVGGYTSRLNPPPDFGYVADQSLVFFGPGAMSVVLDSLRPMFPADTVDSGYVAGPARAYYHNNGRQVAVPNVYRTITPAFKDTGVSYALPPGDTGSALLRRSFALPRGTQILKCTLDVAGDTSPGNNRVMDTVFVRVRDIQADSILFPFTGSVINLDTTVVPQARVTNRGNVTTPACSVKFDVVGTTYSNTQPVPTLAPGAQVIVSFGPWPANVAGVFQAKCSTRYTADINRGNDRVFSLFTVQRLEVQTVNLVRPIGTIEQGTNITPQANVRNNGNTTQTFKARFEIQGGYVDSQTVTLPSGQTLLVTFANWTAGPLGNLPTKCTTRLNGDKNAANDKVTGNIFVQYTDVQTIAILAPTGSVDSGQSIAPQASVHNNGNSTAIFPVRFTIAGGYSGTPTCTLSAYQTKTVTFTPWSAAPRNYVVTKCSTGLTADRAPANDMIKDSVFVRVYDATTEAIIAPVGSVGQGSVIAPQVSIHNNGNVATGGFNARFDISDGYGNVQPVSSINPGASGTVTFADWTANTPGRLATKCSTQLGGDMVSANDRLSDSVTVALVDAEVLSIVAPTGSVDSGTTLAPQANIRNNGTSSVTFNARFGIGAWSDIQSVNLGPGATQLVSFGTWTASSRGTFNTKCTTMLSGDQVPANDFKTGSVTVVVRDAELVSIVAPVGGADSGASVTPQVTVRNNGTANATFNVVFRIGSLYSNIQPVTNLLPNNTQTVGFAPWTVPGRATYTTACTTKLASDMIPANDWKQGSFTGAVRDAELVSIVAPVGGADSGASVTPQVTVRNNGTANATFNVVFRIGSLYSNIQPVTDLPPNNTQTVGFAPWTVPGRATYTTACTTKLASDMIPANDWKQGSFTGAVRDAELVSIVAPVGSADSGASVTPQVTVKNNGTANATFNVVFRIGSLYSNTQLVTDLPPNNTQTVGFAPWTVPGRATYTTACTTKLASDMIPANDWKQGSFTGAVRDAELVSIVAPVGGADSGASVTPQVTVRNNGTANATFNVVFRIGSLYSNIQLVTDLLPNTTQTVGFAPWTVPGRATYTTACTTKLASDMIPANDWKQGSFTGAVRDAELVSIVAPVGSADSGSSVTPQVTVRNNGTANATFDVVFRIGSLYSNTQLVTDLPPNNTQTVGFAPWTVPGRATYTTACTTKLASDMIPANDWKQGSFTGAVRDAELVSIAAPSGTVDSGAIVVPQANVRNNGNIRETFDVRFEISPWSDVQSVTVDPGASQTVSFNPWTATQRGNLVTRCTTLLSGDVLPANDVKTGSVDVAVHDVGAVAIVAPTGSIVPGAVTPRATVHNYGTAREATAVTFMMPEAGYFETVSLPSGLTLGVDTTISFPDWTAVTGSYTTRCSTYLAADQVPANDVVSGGFSVGMVDAGVLSIIGPAGPQDTSAVIAPSAKVKNFGEFAVTFKTFFLIDNGADAVVYGESAAVSNLGAGDSAVVAFVEWAKPHAVGSYSTRCSVYVANDGNHANDAQGGSFAITAAPPSQAGWFQKADVPYGPKSKRVKDGAALAYREEGRAGGYIYALKGNNRCEFYQYSITTNSWATKESIPAIGRSGRKKAVKKGSSLSRAADRLYATKGNNTLEFWQYDPSATDAYRWQQMADVPAGIKNVKEGAGAVGVAIGETAYVYLLKGSNTPEFYRYNTLANAWEPRANAPAGLSGKSFKNGSCIAYDPFTSTVYALKGSYNEFYAYDVDSDFWTTKAALPLIGSSGRKKKVKDGAGIAYLNRIVFGLKGNNTQEFWAYHPDSSRWIQLDDMPLGGGKRVKGGGALVTATSELYATKGNNTFEFWMYRPAGAVSLLSGPSPDVMASGETRGTSPGLRIAPNPFSDAALITYSLPKAGNIRLELYDVAGALVTTLAQGHHTAGSSSFIIHRSSLARGIYLLKLETETRTTTSKLIVE